MTIAVLVSISHSVSITLNGFLFFAGKMLFSFMKVNPINKLKMVNGNLKKGLLSKKSQMIIQTVVEGIVTRC